MKWVVRVWSLPTDQNGFRVLCEPPVIDASVTDRNDANGTGTIKVPADYDKLHLILRSDPTNLSQSASSVIAFHRVENGRVLQVPDVEFFAEEANYELADGQRTVTISGPTIRAGLDDAIVAPHPNLVDWIWGGDNAIQDLSLAALGNIQETWMFYLERERYGLSIDNATEGQIRFTYDGDTSDPVSHDPSASAIKAAIEGLDGINEVYVLKHEDESFTIVILNPTKLDDDLAVEAVPDSGFDGSLDFDKHAEGFDSSSNPTFTISVLTAEGSDTTGDLPWNASTFAIEQALEGLDNVRDVTVQGSGHFGDPWEIVFYVPPQVDNMQVSFAAGSEVIRETVEGRLDPSPVTQSMFADQRIDEFIHGTYGDPPIEVVTDPGLLDDGAEWALKVNAESQFAGSQRVLAVIPGEIYQAKIRVRPTVSGRYRLVIRETLEDNLIKWHTPNEVWLEADGNYHDLVVPDITIPPGVTEVIMRVAVVSSAPSEIGPFYVNWQHAEFVQGLAPATAGQIVKTLLEHAQERGAGTWLDLSFDGEKDTGGTAWPIVHSYQADGFSMYLSDVLADMAELGYEWTVTPKDTPSDGKTHDLNLWVEGGAGDDKTGTGPALVTGGPVVGGEIVKRVPAFTAAVAWGAEDRFVEDEENTSVATYGRLERFIDAEQYHDPDSLQELIDAAFADEASNRVAALVKLDGSGSVVPFVDFDVGDILVWQTPPAMAKNNRRVQVISWRTTAQSVEYEVQGSRIWSGEEALARAVEKLLDAPKKRRRIHPPNPTQFGGGGGIPDVVVAASNTKFKEDADLVCPGNGLDHLTIQQALDRLPSLGGWVHLLEGDYEISDNVDVPIGSGRVVRVTGAGMNLTRIKLAGGVTVDSVFRITNPTSGGTAIFDDLTINGNKSASGTSAVSMIRVVQQASAPTVYLNRVRVVDSPGIGIGSTVRTGGAWRFHHVIVGNSAGAGVQLGETSSMHIGCRYTGIGGDGFNAGALGLVHQFIGCRIDNNGDDGIENSGALA